MKYEECIPLPDDICEGDIIWHGRQEIEEPINNDETLLDMLERKNNIIKTLRNENKHIKYAHSLAMREISQLKEKVGDLEEHIEQEKHIKYWKSISRRSK